MRVVLETINFIVLQNYIRFKFEVQNYFRLNFGQFFNTIKIYIQFCGGGQNYIHLQAGGAKLNYKIYSFQF